MSGMFGRRALVILIGFTFFLAACNKEILTPEAVPQNIELFRLEDIPHIRLDITPQEWNTLLLNFDRNPMNEEYIMADFQFDLNGKLIDLDSMAIRIRGNTSRRRPEGMIGQLHDAVSPDWHHAHFALKFDKYRKTQRFSGLEKVNLKWFKDDASYVREVYCYDLFERYGVWTAPQASYCRLTINVAGDAKPAYFGVYAIIESIDEDYLAARKDKWGSNTGFLWKGGWAGSYNANFVSTASMGAENVKLDPAQSSYYAYDLKTRKAEMGAAQAELAQFISELNAKSGADFEKWIEQKMDVPLFLKTYAVNVMVGMWDDYWVNANNFYFYFSPAGKAYFIPYDYDNTLGTSLLMANSGTQDLLQWGKMSERPLITKILGVEKWRNQYKSFLKELADPGNAYFHPTSSLARIDLWQQMVRSYVANSTGEDMVIEDKPAAWGNAPFYRLQSGNDLGGAAGPANFFQTKIKQVTW